MIRSSTVAGESSKRTEGRGFALNLDEKIARRRSSTRVSVSARVSLQRRGLPKIRRIWGRELLCENRSLVQRSDLTICRSCREPTMRMYYMLADYVKRLRGSIELSRSSRWLEMYWLNRISCRQWPGEILRQHSKVSPCASTSLAASARNSGVYGVDLMFYSL